MKEPPKYLSLYEINTRVYLASLSESIGRDATLDDIPEEEIVHWNELGFDWIWLLSVWTTGPKAQKISRDNPEWRKEFANTLQDLKEKDIAGSGFAIAAYHVHPDLGGNESLEHFRTRLHQHGLRLMLDFVPNHMGPDHPWIEDHPEYFIQGTEDDLKNSPENFTKIHRQKSDLIIAYGRDPFFAGWPDTVQLDYSHPGFVDAMTRELLRISSQCDGVRCDMAMLILPEVFEKTWQRPAISFWPNAITKVREKFPGFCFLAEVYWDMEWTLMQQGFDYAYDKKLYDRLRGGHAREVREHFYARPEYQDKLVRFLENHDEIRATIAFDTPAYKAAAIITFLSPGLRFFHQGQLEGRKKHISPHLIRGPKESIDLEIQKFYMQLLTVLKKPLHRHGNWHLLECVSAWEGNGSWDSFIAFEWERADDHHALVIVNYSPHEGQCNVRLPFVRLAEKQWFLHNQMGQGTFKRDGNELMRKGLFVDLPAWGYYVFDVIDI